MQCGIRTIRQATKLLQQNKIGINWKIFDIVESSGREDKWDDENKIREKREFEEKNKEK